ncbi:MAG TPA: VWA domain-containing protein [Pyrinomonadaceae bacterium]|nr:VWA domain-containing protein [Pyrinomonadaceae bacterium]
MIEARKLDPFVFRIIVFAAFVVLFFIGASHLPAHSQSGRQKTPSPSPTPNNNTRTHQASKPASQSNSAQTSAKSNTKETSSDDTDDVVRVTSHLVPVPTTVVDARGVAIANLRLEDFELSIDGQPKPISDLTRADTPVRMAMLFDNSGSLDASRDFEKRAAVRFFRNVMRPADQAAIYSVSTNVELSQAMTSNVTLLEHTIESFAKPEGATSLYDGIFLALTYLKPYIGRRVIVIVSDGRDTTSRYDHDFEATLQKLSADECQVYVVQTGLYDNANVRDLAAERRMQEFAAQTGGAAYIPKSVGDLDNAFAQISADLAQQYILSYYPASDKRDGKYHLISVRVKPQPNARVRARKGFLVKANDRV